MLSQLAHTLFLFGSIVSGLFAGINLFICALFIQPHCSISYPHLFTQLRFVGCLG
jgi:hypothetical protein